MIEKISYDQMPQVHRGRPEAEEFTEVRNLLPGEAVKFGCRWAHNQGKYRRGCVGVGGAATAARRAGFSVHATCRDNEDGTRTIYVGRPPEGE